MPERSRRCTIHAGRGRRGSMPSMRRAAKRGHASGSSMRTGRTPSKVTGVASTCGSASGAPVIARDVRARPAIDRQSARLGVILSVISVSSRSSASRSGVPGSSAASSAKEAARIVVDAELLAPSTACPRDSTPRIVARLIARPPGSVAPSSAHGASMPAAAFGAPQTIESVSLAPTSTVHTRSRSAFGCGASDVDASRRRRRRTAAPRAPPPRPRARPSSAARTAPPLSMRRIAHRAQPVFGELHRVN